MKVATQLYRKLTLWVSISRPHTHCFADVNLAPSLDGGTTAAARAVHVRAAAEGLVEHDCVRRLGTEGERGTMSLHVPPLRQ